MLVATGGWPDPGPQLPGQELAIDSNGFFELAEQPRRVVVHGAGYIALELACVFQLLGSKVTVAPRGPADFGAASTTMCARTWHKKWLPWASGS